ncbi:MAG: hypothetical protein K6F50_09730 [Kiritimatiellae bacterium]|nr:hypothetical protein [Kiritimatiellia bacterium]
MTIRKFLSAALLIAAGAAFGGAETPSPVRVAVYVGPGARGIGMFRWVQLVGSSPGLEATYVDGAAIREGALKNVDLLAMPGGMANVEADELGKEGKAEVRRFIEEGGSFVGTCAGAFLVMGGNKPAKKTLGLVPYKHLTGHWGGEAMLQVRYTKEAEALAGIEAGSYMERFNGGPVMIPGPEIPGADFKTMAEFESNLHSHSCKTNLPSMGGNASAVAGTFGKGKVWVFAGHPEYYPVSWPSLSAAFKFTTGRDVEFRAPQRKIGQLAVGWWCSPGMGVEGANLALSLMRGGDCDLAPCSGYEFDREDLRHYDALVVPDTKDSYIAKNLVKDGGQIGRLFAFMDRGGKIVSWGEVGKTLGSHTNLILASSAAEVPGILKSIKSAPLPKMDKAPLPKVEKPVRVAEYMGFGAAGASSLKLAKLVSLSPGCEYAAVDADDVRSGALKDFDVYIAPGGHAGDQGDALGPEGLTNIAEFVRSGGGYLGACAGCYMALTRSDTDSPKATRLGFVPYCAQKEPYRGGAELDIRSTDHAPLLGLKPDECRAVHYHGGPVLLPAEGAETSPVKTVATFDCVGVYAHDDAKEPVMTHKSAIVAGPFGDGKVVAISPHPEAYDNTQDMIRGALGYLTGREFKPEYPQRRRGSLSVGFQSSRPGKEGAMFAMRLLREPSLDVRLLDNDGIAKGGLEHCDVLVIAHPKKKRFTEFVRLFAANGGKIVVFGSDKELGKVPDDVPNVEKFRDGEAALNHLLSLAPQDRDWSEIYLPGHPCVSPDGKRVAFEWKDRIWLAPVEGGTAVPLGDGNSCDSRPWISPDSRRIAFMSDRWGPEELFEADLDLERLVASNTRQVTFHTESLAPWGYTPDGKWMVSLAYRDDASESTSSMLFARRPILVSMEGRRAEQLLFDAPAFSPAISPDGKKVLFASNIQERGLELRKRSESTLSPCSGDIWLYDLDTKAFTPIVAGRADCLSPVWTPDGKGFYYLSNERGVRNVRCRSLESGEDRELTHFTDDHVFTPSLSRDGKTMVFAKGFDLWAMDPTSADPKPRRIPLRCALFDPSAPRSVRRSYAKMDNNYGDGNCTFRDGGKEVAFTAGGDLWVMELKDDAAGEPRLLHGSSRTHERDCAFSPDGSTLYYLSDRGDGADLWRMRRADTNLSWSANVSFVRERLTFDDVCRRSLSVSPDGSLLAWQNLQGRLSFARTDGTVVSVAKVESSRAGSYAWSPDGLFVAAALYDSFGNADIWLIPSWDRSPDGKPAPAPCNISRSWKWDGDPAWSADGKTVAFSGDRTATGDVSHLFTLAFDPSAFPDLPKRVRATGVKGMRAFFAPDGRLSFSDDSKRWTVSLPDRMKPEKLLDCDPEIVSWTKAGKDDVILGSIDARPSRGEKAFKFKVHQTTDVHDYQELAFLSDWALLRDGYRDSAMNGADWPAAREKYRLAARYAPCWNAFAHVVNMMHAELDSSHLGFSAKGVSKERWAKFPWDRGWDISTAHLGVRFDRSHEGRGWLVRDVIAGSGADRGEDGVLPGDTVVSVDGRVVMPGMDPSLVLNGPLPHKFRIELERGGKRLVRELDGMSHSEARMKMRVAEVEKIRALAREKGNFGYIAVDSMDEENADAFTDEVFAECFGRDGLIVDVRFNTGGSTAERLIDILCGNRHVRSLYRGMKKEGYIMERCGRPIVAEMPVVVLMNSRTFSNGEVFAHAMRTLGRGKLVGEETAGSVITTYGEEILDYGVARLPRAGVFRMDGVDMEGNGAKPDVEVAITPADIAAGRDPQLSAAFDLLASEVLSRTPPAPCRYCP